MSTNKIQVHYPSGRGKSVSVPKGDFLSLFNGLGLEWVVDTSLLASYWWGTKVIGLVSCLRYVHWGPGRIDSVNSIHIKVTKSFHHISFSFRCHGVVTASRPLMPTHKQSCCSVLKTGALRIGLVSSLERWPIVALSAAKYHLHEMQNSGWNPFSWTKKFAASGTRFFSRSQAVTLSLSRSSCPVVSHPLSMTQPLPITFGGWC